ncbi:hypothetical protein K469DRAFT_526945, partial [Zopfia rhizophila CBS 207.26]
SNTSDNDPKMPLQVPEEFEDRIDKSLWGKSIDPSKTDNTTTGVDTQIIYFQSMYEHRNECDYDLFEAFVVDFLDWTKETFKLASPDVNRRFRDFLRHNGVYIAMDRSFIATRLAELVNEEELPEWPPEELQKEIGRKHMNSRWDKTSPRHAEYFQPNSVSPPIVPIVQSKAEVQSATQMMQTRPPRSSHSRQPSNARDPNDRSHHLGTTPMRARFSSSASGQQFQLPPRLPILPRISSEPNPEVYETGLYESHLTREIINVGKFYNNNPTIQFGGEPFDFLDTKLPIFYDNCTRCALPVYSWHMAFSFMLKGKARQYYYDNLFNKELSFEQLVQRTKDRFHSLENRQMYMREWQSTTLRDTITANPDKTRLQCLDMTIDKLYLIQKGLPPGQQSETILRDQLLSACQGIEECSLALYKPGDTYEKLCDELR